MEKRVSLRNKITTAIVMVILFLGITVTFSIYRILPNALEEEAVKMGVEKVDVRETVNKTLGIVIVVTMLAIVMSVFIGSGLAGLIVKPLNKLRRATEEMADENLDVRLDIQTGDEFQGLAASFNRMAIKLKRSYEELIKSNQELERANSVKSEFLAIMSHELRTPLTAIIGFSELLQEEVMGQLNREQKETLKEVVHNAADLLSMINCMLDLTRIESGRLCLDVVVFDPAEMLKRVCRTIDPLARQKKVELRIDMPDGMPAMKGDERKIQQTVLNLLTNATKFTPEEGFISLTARHIRSWDEVGKRAMLERRFEDAKLELTQGGIEIVVEDSGIGIPEEHFDRVFDSFYQVDTSETRTYGGIGLGLALARQFVEMHGGRIWVESESGKGAKFTIVIPYR